MSPFKIQQSTILPGHHTYVSWSKEAQKFVYSYILLDVLFGVLKCNEVSLAVLLNNREVDTFNISYEEWAQDKSKNYSHYVQQMYEIAGVIFQEQEKAQQFFTWLEQKYMWELLHE